MSTCAVRDPLPSPVARVLPSTVAAFRTHAPAAAAAAAAAAEAKAADNHSLVGATDDADDIIGVPLPEFSSIEDYVRFLISSGGIDFISIPELIQLVRDAKAYPFQSKFTVSAVAAAAAGAAYRASIAVSVLVLL